MLIEATRLLATGKPDDAAELRDKAFDLSRRTSGKMDDTDFAWIANSDPRLGPVHGSVHQRQLHVGAVHPAEGAET